MDTHLLAGVLIFFFAYWCASGDCSDDMDSFVIWFSRRLSDERLFLLRSH